MDTETLKQIGLTDLFQAKIYLHLIDHGQQTPTEIAESLSENRTTIYSAAENHLRLAARQSRNLEANLPPKPHTPIPHKKNPAAYRGAY